MGRRGRRGEGTAVDVSHGGLLFQFLSVSALEQFYRFVILRAEL